MTADKRSKRRRKSGTWLVILPVLAVSLGAIFIILLNHTTAAPGMRRAAQQRASSETLKRGSSAVKSPGADTKRPQSSKPAGSEEKLDIIRIKVLDNLPPSLIIPTNTRLAPIAAVQLKALSNETNWRALKVNVPDEASPGVNNIYVYRSFDDKFSADDDWLIGKGRPDTTIPFSDSQKVVATPLATYFVVFEVNNQLKPDQVLEARLTAAGFQMDKSDSVAPIKGDFRISAFTNPHSSTSQCFACHELHDAPDEKLLLKVATKDPGIVNAQSADFSQALCFSCHDGSGANSDIKTDYNPALATPRQQGAGDASGSVVSPGHMTDRPGETTGGYLPTIRYGADKMMPCMVCHDVHFSTNNSPTMLADSLYDLSAGATETTVNTNASYYWDSSATLWSSPAIDAAARRQRCIVCHRNHVGSADTTSTTGTGSFADRKSVVIGLDLGRPATHAPGDPNFRDSRWCGDCHGVHKIEVPAPPGGGSESPGNVACEGCHIEIDRQSKETTSYHHYMQNAGVTNLPSSGSKYPVKSAYSTADTEAAERRCLACHVDHDIFSPEVNPPSGNRGKNLRASVAVIPTTDPVSFSNTDFDASQTQGGICVSCHSVQQVKNTAKQKFDAATDSTNTMAVAKDLYGESTPGHSYEVTSTFKGLGVDPPTNRPFEFRANCAKCHNTIDQQSWPYDAAADTGSAQDSPFKFGLHATEVRRLLAWLNITPQDATADPMEENACVRCHSRNPAGGGYNPNGGATGSGQDYYNKAAMNAATLDVRGAFTKTYNHPIGGNINAGYRSRHRADEGQAPNWNPDGARHVECEDCHNPHAARRPSSTDATSGYDGGKVRGPNKGVWGVTVGGNQKYAAGTASFANGSANVTGVGTAWSGTLQPGWHIKNNYDIRGRWYKISTVNSNTQLTLARAYDGSNFSSGGPGTLIFNNVDYAAVTATYSRTESAPRTYQICLKCHTAYAYDDLAPNSPTGAPGGSAVRETEVGLDFLPTGYAIHPVIAKGLNQPITPTGQTAGAASYYNYNWPKFTTGTVSVDVAGAATFTNAVPTTVIPGWYLYVGATNPPSPTTQNWYQVTSVTTLTSLSVTPTPAAPIAGQPFALSAGLGNTFVAPIGPWALITCSDCHKSEVQPGSQGPHGSNSRWLLKEATRTINTPWYNGSSVVTVNTAYGAGTNESPAWDPTRSTKNFCFTCHRRDVYGDFDGGGANPFDNPNTAVTVEGNLSRVAHDPCMDTRTYAGANKNKWEVVCFNCHAGDMMGSMHGSSAKKGLDSASIVIGNSYRGKRFLNGATWAGVTRATTSVGVTCWTKAGAGLASTDEVNSCNKSHAGAVARTAIYDYDAAPD